MNRVFIASAALAFCAACGNNGDRRIVGTLERDRIDVAAEFAEPITRLLVTEGDIVEAGQALVEQDSSVLASEIARAGATLDEARGRLAEARARADEAKRGSRREQIAEARARLSGAEARVAGVRRDLERARGLFENGATSRADYDQWKQKTDEAAAARDEARSALDEALNGNTAETIRAAQAAESAAIAAVAAAQASLDELMTRGARLVLRAPVAGRVDALPFEVGERPPVGGAVVRLLADSAPYARVYVPETIRAEVAPGMRAKVRIDGRKNAYDGVVRIVSHDASFTPYFALTEHDRGRLSYLAEITLVSPEARQLPTGLPCEAEFEFQRR